MSIVRQDQPVNASEPVRANRGETNLYFVGIGSDADTSTTDAPAFVGTPDGSMVLHACAYSTSNTVAQSDVGTAFSCDRTSFQASFTPLSSLPIGTAVIYDLHAKDIQGWVGDWPSFAELPTGQAVDSIAWTGGNYYRFNGTEWINETGNITGDGVTDVFSSITFTIQDSGNGGGGGETGTFTRNDQSRTWTIGTSVGTSSQFTVGGTGSTQDAYENGSAPVILSTADDPINSGTQYAYNATASTETNSNGHGTLDRLPTGSTFDVVQYNSSGNEVAGDSYVYNIVCIDANGDIVYSTLTINIATSGGGDGAVKTINAAALAAFTSTTNRISAPFVQDFSDVLNNPSGTGTLAVVGPFANCSASDFSVNGNIVTCTKSNGGDFNFNLEVI